MFLTSLSGTIRVDRPEDVTPDEIRRRLSHQLTHIGLIVLADQPGLVAFATPTVTDGKTWWWLNWKLFTNVNRGSFELRGITHDVIAYNLPIRRLLFRTLASMAPFFILIFSAISQHNPLLMLIPIGFGLLGYLGARFTLWFRIRRWVREVVARPIQSDDA